MEEENLPWELRDLVRKPWLHGHKPLPREVQRVPASAYRVAWLHLGLRDLNKKIESLQSALYYVCEMLPEARTFMMPKLARTTAGKDWAGRMGWLGASESE